MSLCTIDNIKRVLSGFHWRYVNVSLDSPIPCHITTGVYSFSWQLIQPIMKNVINNVVNVLLAIFEIFFLKFVFPSSFSLVELKNCCEIWSSVEQRRKTIFPTLGIRTLNTHSHGTVLGRAIINSWILFLNC